MSNPFEDTRIATGYDAWFGTDLGGLVDRLEMQLVMELARPQAGERALDVGTGTGHFAAALAARGLEVVGLDASEAMLAVARARSAAVTWQRGQAEALPFGDGAFPLVLSVTALEFMRDPALALDEMCRVTAPGGRMVVAVLNRESAWGRMYTENARESGSPFRGAHLYTPDEFVAALSRFGRPTWGSAVFFPPDGPGEGDVGAQESAARIAAPGKGAMLVGRVSR
ncbi:MAG: class I SAM-dependent methyltransferase [Anaerolineae bacterium]